MIPTVRSKGCQVRTSAALVLLGSLVSLPAHPRSLERGTVEIGGSSSLMYVNQTQSPEGDEGDTDLTVVSVGVDLDFYILKNLGAGLLLSYQKASADFSESDGLDASAILIGPQVKYNLDLSERTNLFVTGVVGFQRAKLTETTDGVEEVYDDVSGRFWSAGAGAKFFLNELASIDVSVRYQSAKLEDGEVFSTAGFVVGAGFTLYLH